VVPNLGFSDFSEVRNAIFEGESLYVLGCTFFKASEIYESLQVLLLERTLSGLILPSNNIKLTIEIAKCVHWYFCFTLRLPC